MAEEKWETTEYPANTWIVIKTDTDGVERIGCTCATGCCISGMIGRLLLGNEQWRPATEAEIKAEALKNSKVADMNWSDMYIEG